MKVVHCPCGTNVEGEGDDELVGNVEQHIASDHPDMVGKYSREQILERTRPRTSPTGTA